MPPVTDGVMDGHAYGECCYKGWEMPPVTDGVVDDTPRVSVATRAGRCLL